MKNFIFEPRNCSLLLLSLPKPLLQWKCNHSPPLSHISSHSRGVFPFHLTSGTPQSGDYWSSDIGGAIAGSIAARGLPYMTSEVGGGRGKFLRTSYMYTGPWKPQRLNAFFINARPYPMYFCCIWFDITYEILNFFILGLIWFVLQPEIPSTLLPTASLRRSPQPRRPQSPPQVRPSPIK